MKILVTGVNGLVGSACKELFASKDWEVIGIDNNLRHKMLGSDIPKTAGQGEFYLDIRDEISMDWIFSEHKFDAIIHAAGQPSHDWSADHVLEDFDINTRGTMILLEATRKYCPEAIFVYVSTDKVYGEKMECELGEFETRYSPLLFLNRQGFKENLGLDFAGKRSPFGCSKTAADIYVQEYGNYFDMKTACFRPGCITGKNHEGAELHGFLAYLAKCIKNGTTYKIFGNGKNVRDQIHASDLASAFFEFVSSPKSGAVYNFGGGPGRSVSVLEAGEALSKAIGKPFLHEFHEARKGDRLWDVHDISKFRRDYPEWNYKYSLSDIIADLCN